MRKSQLLLLLLLSLVLISCEEKVIDPDDYKGNLLGYVYDFSTDEPLVNCNVTLKPTVGSQRTLSSGQFYFLNILEGSYNVTVEKIGYKTYEGNVIITREERTTVSIV